MEAVMKKQLELEDLIKTNEPMNSIAYDDAMYFLGFDNHTCLSPVERKKVRAKKRKIITAYKKLNRRVGKEILKYAEMFKR